MSDQDPVTGRPVTPPAAPTTAAGVPPVAPSSTTIGGGSGDQSKTDQAKVKAEQAKNVAGEKKDAAKEKVGEATGKASAAAGAVGDHAGEVADSAKSHAGAAASEVIDEAKRQASGLVEQGMGTLRSQAEQQAERAAEFLQGLSDQLSAMARGEQAPESHVSDLMKQGAQRIEEVASRLRTGGFEMAARDLQRFARRRPGVFLASTFGAGLAAGRVFKNTETSHFTSSDSSGQGVQSGAELDLRRGGVPVPATTTGTVGTGVPGAPTMGAADPLVAGDPTGQLGGPR